MLKVPRIGNVSLAIFPFTLAITFLDFFVPALIILGLGALSQVGQDDPAGHNDMSGFMAIYWLLVMTWWTQFIYKVPLAFQAQLSNRPTLFCALAFSSLLTMSLTALIWGFALL